MTDAPPVLPTHPEEDVMATRKMKDLSKKSVSNKKASAIKGGRKKKAPSLFRSR
jgi:hypothetical protein